MSVTKFNQKIANFWRRSLQNQWLLLLVWIAIATCLRLINLTSKPPWADEFSTLVFSLGNSFDIVPLEQAIAPDILLQPLQPNPNAKIQDVIHNLLTHSNHPPIYFILAHWWMQLFLPEAGLVSLWGARFLSAIFGVASIPAIYCLGRLAFRSRLVGQLAAGIMAVSPYSIYLAQEARHYTLAILFVIASFCCLTVSLRHFQQDQSLPIYVAFIWALVNSLGIAIHYFFTLSLCAEAIVLIVLVWLQTTPLSKFNCWLVEAFDSNCEGGDHMINTSKLNRQTKTDTNSKFFWINLGENYQSRLSNKFSFSPIILCKKTAHKVKKLRKFIPHTLLKSLASFCVVIFGTLAGGLIWLPFWKNGYSTELTEWILVNDSTLKNLISPIFQFLATGITMLFLLPIESPNFVMTIISALVMILFLIWVLPLFVGGIITCLKKSEFRLSTIVFSGIILASILLFVSFTYVLGIDLTRGARYSFVYFPVIIVLVAAILGEIFNQQFVKSKFFNLFICTTTGKNTVVLVWLMALLSGLTVVSNLGYQKYYRPDLLVSLMQKKSDIPILIATAHYTHVETGELMGIAWNMREIFKKDQLKTDLKSGCNEQFICQKESLVTAGINLDQIKFILVHQKPDREKTISSLQQTINKLEHPLDLWLVNFGIDLNLKVPSCQIDMSNLPLIDGYKYQLYHCD